MFQYFRNRHCRYLPGWHNDHNTLAHTQTPTRFSKILVRFTVISWSCRFSMRYGKRGHLLLKPGKFPWCPASKTDLIMSQTENSNAPTWDSGTCWMLITAAAGLGAPMECPKGPLQVKHMARFSHRPTWSPFAGWEVARASRTQISSAPWGVSVPLPAWLSRQPRSMWLGNSTG